MSCIATDRKVSSGSHPRWVIPWTIAPSVEASRTCLRLRRHKSSSSSAAISRSKAISVASSHSADLPAAVMRLTRSDAVASR